MRFLWKNLVSHAVLNAALVAVALLSGCSAQPVACRPAAQSCGEAAACCDGLSCTDNTCQAPGLGVPDAGNGGGDTHDLSMGGGNPDFSMGGEICGNGKCGPGETTASCCTDCGCATGASCTANVCITTVRCGDGICQPSESMSSCCEDCGCPSDYTCEAKTCQKNVVCGDGICQVGETTDNCCEDCGCPAEYSCSAHVCHSPFSTLSWVVTDSCYDGEEIDYKFYDVTRGLVWPSAVTHWTINPGDTTTRSLSCYTGDKICLGGEQSGHGLFWGVDVDDSKSCVGCCFTCADGPVSIGPLTCS